MKKIAVVVQRYGVEITGGAELLTRLLSERLCNYYDIEIITTCAFDYTTWENYYPKGDCEVNGIRVRRFAVEKTRDMDEFKKLAIIPAKRKKEKEWVYKQGPYCPELIKYINAEKDTYDVFVFMTYLYYTTVFGIQEARNKAILIPTAHDEAPIYLGVYRDVFTCPKHFVFNTEEEQELVHRIFNNQNIPGEVLGAGIEMPEDANPAKFKEKHGLSDYLLYAGRVDQSKNCPELFNYFIEYKKRNPSDLKLVLMGKEFIEVPKHPDIISLGFVSDEDKNNGMAGAKIFVLPSIYESLSMVVLESMASGIPVVADGRCEVVKGHCLKSNAGLYYSGYLEFEGCINYLLSNDDVYEAMSINAKSYVEKNYRWDVIIDKLKGIIESTME